MDDAITMDQLRKHAFENTRDKRELLAGLSCAVEAEGNLLTVENGDGPRASLRNKDVCENISPIDNEMSQVHETEVHVF